MGLANGSPCCNRTNHQHPEGEYVQTRDRFRDQPGENSPLPAEQEEKHQGSDKIDAPLSRRCKGQRKGESIRGRGNGERHRQALLVSTSPPLPFLRMSVGLLFGHHQVSSGFFCVYRTPSFSGITFPIRAVSRCLSTFYPVVREKTKLASLVQLCAGTWDLTREPMGSVLATRSSILGYSRKVLCRRHRDNLGGDVCDSGLREQHPVPAGTDGDRCRNAYCRFLRLRDGHRAYISRFGRRSPALHGQSSIEGFASMR